MHRPLSKEYPGLPVNHFPLSPVTVYWLLDAGGDIPIARKGFPVVPNFSTTVDGATGKTLETSIPDLGAVQLAPTFTWRSVPVVHTKTFDMPFLNPTLPAPPHLTLAAVIGFCLI